MYGENKVFPAVALRGMTVLPGMIVHFDISRAKSIAAVEQSMLVDKMIFLVTQKDSSEMEPGIEDLHNIGVVSEVKQILKMPDKSIRVVAEGMEKAMMVKLDESEQYLQADVEIISSDSDNIDEVTAQGMVRVIKELVVKYEYQNPKFSKDLAKEIMEADDLDKIVNLTGNSIPMYYEQKQHLLEAVDAVSGYEIITKILVNEIDILRVRNELQKKVKEAVDKNQRDYVMREQIKVIRKELGDDDTDTEFDQFNNKLKRIKADKAVKEKIRKEIKRFKNMGSGSSESGVQRGYIEVLLDLPWNKMSVDNNDIKNAQKVLNEAHYGLDKVKERILEYLAVRIFAGESSQSTILCLVGPPGTGKTSIAKSVAEALGKKYVRICLGGVKDEAEIRGHRRTYVGAMPGRIVKSLQQAGVGNPLMLLDEIDKLGNDYKGDPASALLEVLDSEQNEHFSDHYLELPVDLSKVLFIATANSTDTIPRPLLDRMEIIQISGYTENEKLHIANEHLISKQIKKHGLTDTQLTISSKAVASVIRSYTREAGVRNLERSIASICRKAVKEILETNKKNIRVTEANIEKFLGKKKFRPDKINEQAEAGIVRGLAWTSVGGDTLEIEVNTMPGKGELKLTGKLGDVMKESALTALSFVRSLSNEYAIEKKYFEKNDIHIHVPEGAVPKDGPSAGVTMATAILSAVTNTPVKADIAMTGEITLRGRALAIGGLKEKLLAAKLCGIKKVFVPDENRPDVEEISSEIKKGIEIVYVENVRQIIKEAFVKIK